MENCLCLSPPCSYGSLSKSPYDAMYVVVVYAGHEWRLDRAPVEEVELAVSCFRRVQLPRPGSSEVERVAEYQPRGFVDGAQWQ